MNSLLLKSVRVNQGKTQADIAKVIGRTKDTYSKKERGIICFSPDEISAIAQYLNLSINQVNEIFFDLKLPIVK
jgi:DNA-binding XRE family transcriptional regulator